MNKKIWSVVVLNELDGSLMYLTSYEKESDAERFKEELRIVFARFSLQFIRVVVKPTTLL